jgi:hypothetical protein
VFRSDDGLSWERLGEGLADNQPVRALAVASDGDIYCGTDDGVFLLDTDDRWQPRSQGLPEDYLITTLVSDERRILAGTVGAGLFELTYTKKLHP